MGSACCGEDLMVKKLPDYEWGHFIKDQVQLKSLHQIITNIQAQSKSTCYKDSIQMKNKINNKRVLYCRNKKFMYGDLDDQGNGSGIICRIDSNIYQGSIANYQPHGKGKYYNSSYQLIQSGQWKQGRFAKGIIYPYGSISNVRSIQIKENKKYIIKYQDGSSYEGGGILQTNKFIKQGQGTFTIPHKKYKYIGEWKDNKRSGKVTKVQHQQQTFDGLYKDDVRYKGILKKDGDQYHGQWTPSNLFTGTLKRNGQQFQIQSNQPSNILRTN